MDRASDSGSEGWGFESLPVYQTNKRDTHSGIPLICFALRAGRNSKIEIQQPGGLLGDGEGPIATIVYRASSPVSPQKGERITV